MQRVLGSDARARIVATAARPEEVAARHDEVHPDVILLALSFLRQGGRRLPLASLLGKQRMRLVLLSDEVESSTRTAQEEASRALLEGAMDVLLRPPSHDALATDLFVERVLALARAGAPSPRDPVSRDASPQPIRPARLKVIGVVASAGGPAALVRLLANAIPAPLLVAQHIPRGFVGSFAAMLRRSTGQDILIAEEGMQASPSRVYLAPDGADLAISPQLRLQVLREGTRSIHPSGDVLLEHLASFGPAAAGVVLTGMGEDGLAGAARLRRAGGRILAQNRETSVVNGMPGAVVAAGLADAALPPESIAELLCAWCSE